MRVFLVSHCAAGPVTGRPDEAGDLERCLSDDGRLQAAAICRHLGGAPLDAIYAGPSLPARATAAVIARELAIEASSSDDAAAHAAAAAAAVDAAALAAIQEQAWAEIEALKEQHPPEARLVLVSDAAAIGAIVCRALSLDLADAGRFEIAPASVSLLEFRGQRTLIAALNHVCHLDGLG